MEDVPIFLKISAPRSLKKTYRLILISAGSISLDCTFEAETKRDKELSFLTWCLHLLAKGNIFYLSKYLSTGIPRVRAKEESAD
jgi:hypothetical protein